VKPEEEEICRRTTPSGGSITSFGIFVSPLWLPTAGTAEGQKHYKQPYVHRPMSYNQSEMPSAARKPLRALSALRWLPTKET